MLSAQAKTISQRNCVDGFTFSPLILSSLISPICPSSPGRQEGRKLGRESGSIMTRTELNLLFGPCGVLMVWGAAEESTRSRRWPFTGHNCSFPADPPRVNECKATGSHERKAEEKQNRKKTPFTLMPIKEIIASYTRKCFYVEALFS